MEGSNREIILSKDAMGVVPSSTVSQKAGIVSTVVGSTTQLMVDSGSTEIACSPHDFPHVTVVKKPQRLIHSATGAQISSYVSKKVDFIHEATKEPVRLNFEVMDIVRPRMGVSKTVEMGQHARVDS